MPSHGHGDPAAARPDQGDRQRLLDRKRVGTEVVPHCQFRLYASLVEIGAESESQRLDAEEIDLLAEQPARIIFAKAVRRDERLGLVFVGVGLQIGARGTGHEITLWTISALYANCEPRIVRRSSVLRCGER